MSSPIKIGIALFCLLMTSGCSSVFTSVPDVEHKIITPAPLELEDVSWNVIIYEDIPYFALDTQNYEKLSRNTEKTQNRLFLYKKTIDELNQ